MPELMTIACGSGLEVPLRRHRCEHTVLRPHCGAGAAVPTHERGVFSADPRTPDATCPAAVTLKPAPPPARRLVEAEREIRVLYCLARCAFARLSIAQITIAVPSRRRRRR